VVARTEYLEGARTRWFLLSTLLGPLLLGAISVLPAWLQTHAAARSARIAIVDESEAHVAAVLAGELSVARPGEKPQFVAQVVTGADAAPERLSHRIEAGELDGWLRIPRDLPRGGEVIYRGVDASSPMAMGFLRATLHDAVVHARAQTQGLDEKAARALLAPVPFDARQSSGESDSSGGAAFIIAFAVAIVLYMSILLYAVAVMRSVLQEKSSRVMEVVVACCRPRDLLLGKVLGVGSLGLTQLFLWLSASLLIAHQRGPLLARFGIQGAAAFHLPSVSAATIVLLLVYFVGGFFLYAAIFGAVGAANNTQQEAQQMQMPITFLLIGAFLCFPVITGAPRDSAAVGLTMVPFFSPVLMPMRMMLTPVPWWQIAVSVAILVGTILVIVGLAGRIYRVGVLSYGKRPSFGELLRWLRQGD
jgi:ABC-2 type transport system permease protein